MYCSECKVHHKPSAFGAQQRRKPATIRVCKTPIVNGYVYEDGMWRWRSGPRNQYAIYMTYDIELGNQRMLKRTKDNGSYVDVYFDRWEV